MFTLKVFPGAIEVSMMLLGSTFIVVPPAADINGEKNIIEEATIKERQSKVPILRILAFITDLTPLSSANY
jgi:hypothetical protein